MRASLDTNVIIHFYRAGRQYLLFELFEDGVIIYEQIRTVELEHHGQEVLAAVDADIEAGTLVQYTDDMLKQNGVLRIFQENVKENRKLYSPQDLGEVYAISLAQTLGVYSLVTDDTKRGGPYDSLLQFADNEIMPFHFVDVLVLRYLFGLSDAKQTVSDFNAINECSCLNWSLKSKLASFIRRFHTDPFREDDVAWLNGIIEKYGIDLREKMMELRDAMQSG